MINETRPAGEDSVIQNIDMLRTDWREIRNDVRSAVQSVVKEMRRERYTRFANELAKRTFGRKDFGVIIEDSPRISRYECIHHGEKKKI